MADELPDWLAEMRDQQLGQQLEQESGPKREVIQNVGEDLGGPTDRQTEPPQDQEGPGDILGDLREQMAQAEEELGYDEEKSSLARVFSGLQPQQRFVLAVLLFLDVALCGCMALVMAGRVGLPF